jgi:hypothetical protein
MLGGAVRHLRKEGRALVGGHEWKVRGRWLGNRKGGRGVVVGASNGDWERMTSCLVGPCVT